MRRILLILSLFSLAALCSCSGTADDADSAPESSPATPVVLAEATVQPMEEVLEVIGTARADESVELTAKVTEKVRKMHFEDGEYVEEGTVLVEMTSDEESALLNEALANLREQDRNYERIRMLYADETVSLSDLDQADTKLKTAQSRVRSIEAQLA
ncbi:MAG: efflux RND transporter periplasmic adaptor subunit, partial [Oceanidesulfovibrio sp.]